MRDYKIAWQSPEYEYVEKSSDWFWAMGIISVGIAVTSIVLGNILFAVLIIVGACSLAIYAIRKPEFVYYEVSQRGVVVNDKLYPYSSLDSFWVEHGTIQPKLFITSKKLFMPQIVINIGSDVDTDDLRDYLLDYVDEEEQRESLSTIIMEYLGF
jgi:hypothetical protein